MSARPACVLALVALAGCGQGGGPSLAEFSARAEAICADRLQVTAPLHRQVREAARLSEPALVFRRTALLQREIAETAGETVDRLDATPHPEDDEDLRAWMATLRRARAAREALAEAYGARDMEEIARAAAATDALEQRADRFARTRGMPSCAALS